MESFFSILNETYSQTIILFATAAITIGIYLVQKITERRDAARIIIIQIDSIKQKIEILMRVLGTDVFSYDAEKFWQVDNVIADNEWEKYRHLFVRKLNYNEIVSMNNYFDMVVSIKSQQEHIRNAMTEINIRFYEDKMLIEDEEFKKGQMAPYIRASTLYLSTIQLQYGKIMDSRDAIPYEKLKRIARI